MLARRVLLRVLVVRKRSDGTLTVCAMPVRGVVLSGERTASWWWLRPHCRQQRLNAEDVHDACEIVGQYMQGHLGGHARNRLHQEVGCTHPHAHRLRVLIETVLHGLEHVFVFPPCDPAFRTVFRVAWVCCSLRGRRGYELLPPSISAFCNRCC